MPEQQPPRHDSPYRYSDAERRADMSAAERDLMRMEQLASWLDDRFVVPGTGIRFGLDPILGLIPGIGDSATAALTAYGVWIARRHGLPLRVTLAMLANLMLDWLLGSIPVLGDLFDVGFKANRRNLTLLRRHLGG